MEGYRGDGQAWRPHQQQQEQQQQQQQQQQYPVQLPHPSASGQAPQQRGNVSPLLSWQQQQQQQQSLPLPQQHVPQRTYEYAPTLPVPMQAYSSQNIGSPTYASLPLQYQPAPSPTYAQQQPRYNATYAAYAPQQARPHLQPTVGAPAALPGLASTWYPPSEQFYPGQISPEDSSRHLAVVGKERASASPIMRSGSGSGSGGTASASLPLSVPIDESARWSGYSASGSGSGQQRVYPTGLVGHRGSYSTISSSGSMSRSPTQPISFQYSSGSSSLPYQDISATSMVMPPPNPPPEIRMPIEQEMQRRAATACNFCRARKLRCDGSAPCRQCARRDLECVFSDTNPAKRRKKQEGRDDDDDGNAGAPRKVSLGETQRSGRASGASSSFEAKSSSSSSSRRGSDRQDDTGPRRRQSKAGIEIETYSSQGVNLDSAATFSPSLPALVWTGEKSWCRPNLPLYGSPIWQQRGDGGVAWSH